MKKIVLGAALLLASEGLFAQRNMLRYADIEFDLKRFEHAGSQYAEAFSIKESYYSARRAAESYTYIKSYQKAFEWWGKAVAMKESTRADVVSYARSAVQAGRDLSALGISLTAEERAQVYGQQEVSFDETIAFRPLEHYNSSGTDYGLVKDLEGRDYFVSDRDRSVGTVKKPIRFDVRNRYSGDDRYRMNDRGYHGIYVVRDENIEAYDVPLEGIYHVGTPHFYSVDGRREAVFTAVLRDRKGGKTRIYEAHPGLFRAEVKEDGSMGTVTALPFNSPRSYGVMHGMVHGNRLYFSSDMPGGHGGFDLYYSELTGTGFGPAVNLGPEVNGAGDEVFPFVQNGRLYFSSDRPEGLGGLDIYTVDLTGGNRPVNMGRPYNSGQDDFAYYEDGRGMKYLSSDRGMSESRDDIYAVAFLLDRYRLRVFAENGERLDGMEGLELKVIGPDGKELPIEINDGRVANLNEGDYTVEIRRKGYFPARIPLNALAPDGGEKVLDYKMVAVPYGRMLAIDTVYYDLDKYNIRPDAASVLNRAFALLGEFPEFNLNITSHTDSRASKAYNDKLSENRSRSAASYLRGSGVAGERLSQGWKGESQPVNPCTDGVDCPESMHDRNRRSILSLELFPDRDSDYQLPSGLEYVQSTEELMEVLSRMVKEKRSVLAPDVLSEDIVYYDLDRYEIRKDAEAVLRHAEELLKMYPFLKLEIISHTDARQTDMYNDRLSKNRSMSVFFHLRNRGIAGERMKIGWYSEYLHAEPCPDGVDCTEEQHQRNRRSVLKLMVDKADRSKLPSAVSGGNLDFRRMLELSDRK